MEASELKPNLTKIINENSCKKQNKTIQRNSKKNLIFSQKKQLNKFDNIEYNNNNDDYLEIPKYQTSFIINNNNSDNEKRLDSIGKNSTTNSSSSHNEYNTPKRNNNYILNIMKNNDNKKYSFPIYIYYEGTDKVLIEKNPNNFDYSKTNNFISKEVYFNRIHQEDINLLCYPNNIFQNQKREFNAKNKEKKISYKNNNDKFDIPFNNNYDYMIRDIQSANLFFNYISINNQNKNENNQKNYFNKGKKGKAFTERNGDWICSSCKNLNFAFRIICNRCHLSKVNSEKSANEKDYKDNYSNENNYKYSYSQKENNYINNNKNKDVNNINEKKTKE